MVVPSTKATAVPKATQKSGYTLSTCWNSKMAGPEMAPPKNGWKDSCTRMPSAGGRGGRVRPELRWFGSPCSRWAPGGSRAARRTHSPPRRGAVLTGKHRNTAVLELSLLVLLQGHVIEVGGETKRVEAREGAAGSRNAAEILQGEGHRRASACTQSRPVDLSEAASYRVKLERRARGSARGEGSRRGHEGEEGEGAEHLCLVESAG
eukprot:scaffold83_cov246-Pinguiococcus_pyrenoidosus.AAC.21